jgi:hypothetical protein
MRTELLSAITAAVSTLTQFAVSTELPWSQGDLPLYQKNMKRIYVDNPQVEQTTLIPTLSGIDFYSTVQISSVYVTVDAKNPPTQLDNLITKILSARDTTGVVTFGAESDYQQELTEDKLTYTFEFRLETLTT